MAKYSWETALHLAEKVQVHDLNAAIKTTLSLIESIDSESQNSSFEEIKLRVLQILTIASRAAYSAEANTDELFRLNIDMVREILSIESKKQLLEFSTRFIDSIVSLVQEKDCFKAQKVKEAIRYIRDNPQKNFSREHVASKVGCSSSYLSNIFMEITGRTYKDFVLKYRMEAARKLLLDTKKTISDVAYEIGYDDPNYFSTSFKKVTGISPSKFRRFHSK